MFESDFTVNTHTLTTPIVQKKIIHPKSNYWIEKNNDVYAIGKNNDIFVTLQGNIAKKIFILMNWQNTYKCHRQRTENLLHKINCHGTIDWLLTKNASQIISKDETSYHIHNTIRHVNTIKTPHFCQIFDEQSGFIAHSFMILGYNKIKNCPIIFEKGGFFKSFKIRDLQNPLQGYPTGFNIKAIPITQEISSSISNTHILILLIRQLSTRCRHLISHGHSDR